MTTARAAFLDRDGVINVDRNYVHRIVDFEFLPGVLDACRRIAEAGYLLVVITNQAGIARGYYGVPELEELNTWMTACFAEAGAPLSAIYYCPHHPEGVVAALRQVCDCRKPSPGLLLRAQRDLGVDLQRSFLVGDKLSDIEAGRRAGVGRCFLVTTAASTQGAATRAGGLVTGLPEVADIIA